ncbi:MAG: hypothetical protein M1275_02850 [Patescibacteria group bacterium]|nr:hypothetical protein [Patescibacteria group bacterium]
MRKRSGALWTVQYCGSDPFGAPILSPLQVQKSLGILTWARKAGLIHLFSAHDDDLLPWEPKNPEDYLDPKAEIHDRLLAIKEQVDNARLPMNMITCSLHGNPIFTAGGFTNRDSAVRLLAVKKALRAGWIGNFLGAKYVTYWTARDGFECHSCDPTAPESNPYVWLSQALNIVAAACKAAGGSIEHGTIEPKVNEPRGYSYVPLVGSALAFILQLADPEFWGVNPEVPQHAAMGCQNPYLEIKQALHFGKLFFLHLGGQIWGQFDNDFPVLVGENKELMVHIFNLLEEYRWKGVLEFDCHPLRSDLASGLSEEQHLEIFRQFLTHNAMMTALIERILVPRIRQSDPLQEEVLRLNLPRHSMYGDHLVRTGLLALPPAKAAESIAKASVPAEISNFRQNHLAVEQAFNLALYGVNDDDLATAMAKEDVAAMEEDESDPAPGDSPGWRA